VSLVKVEFHHYIKGVKGRQHQDSRDYVPESNWSFDDCWHWLIGNWIDLFFGGGGRGEVREPEEGWKEDQKHDVAADDAYDVVWRKLS